MGFMAGIFYFTCFLLGFFNLKLLFYMNERNMKSQSTVGNFKYIIILTVFSASYLYRAIYDTLLAFTDILENLKYSD
jgi:hypothetical protein